MSVKRLEEVPANFLEPIVPVDAHNASLASKKRENIRAQKTENQHFCDKKLPKLKEEC